jgi:hypothetical protein
MNYDQESASKVSHLALWFCISQQTELQAGGLVHLSVAGSA